jgi:hypothetical protein
MGPVGRSARARYGSEKSGLLRGIERVASRLVVATAEQKRCEVEL